MRGDANKNRNVNWFTFNSYSLNVSSHLPLWVLENTLEEQVKIVGKKVISSRFQYLMKTIFSIKAFAADITIDKE